MFTPALTPNEQIQDAIITLNKIKTDLEQETITVSAAIQKVAVMPIAKSRGVLSELTLCKFKLANNTQRTTRVKASSYISGLIHSLTGEVDLAPTLGEAAAHNHDLAVKTKARQAEIVTMTPALARKFLELNTRNRKIKKNSLDKIKRELLAGNWRYTGDTITINKAMEITNGQHRLTACVQTGVSFEVLIAYGVDLDSFNKQDQIAQRGSSAQLSYNGVPNAVSIGSTCRILSSCNKDRIMYQSTVLEKAADLYSSISPDAKKTMQRAVNLLRRKSGGFSATAPDYFAAFLLLLACGNEAESFINAIVSGITVDDNTIALRTYRLTCQVFGGYTNSNYRTMEIIKAWFVAYSGKKITKRNSEYKSGDTLLDIVPEINTALMSVLLSHRNK